MSTAPLSDLPQRYVRAAVSLNQSIARNQDDTEFAAQDGNEIIYIFDTNVFIYYLDLEDGFDLAHNFGSLVGSRTSTPDFKAIERLTADFLFSRHLPGQRDGIGYITVPHFEEAIYRADLVQKRLKAELDYHERKGFSSRSEADVAAIQDILDGTLPFDKKLSALARVAPKAWLDTLRIFENFDAALREAFLDEPRLLTPLDQSPWTSASPMRLSEIANWKKVLPRPSKSRLASLIQNDAEALQVVFNLNRDFSLNADGKVTKRFLLVTSDDALVKSVARRSRYLEKAQIEPFVRYTEDYLPLLNLNGMSRAFGEFDPESHVSKDFTKVFTSLKAAVEWVGLAPADELGRISFDNGDTPLHALQRDWAKASQYATLLGIRYFHRRTKDVFERIGKFVSSAEGTTLAAKSVRETVNDVRDRHLAIILEGALASVKLARDTQSAAAPRRVNILLLSDFLAPVLGGHASIVEYLDDAVEKARLSPATLDFVTHKPGAPEVLLLAACLFVAAERWEPAAQFAARAYEAIRSRKTRRASELRDSAYIRALSLRFSMKTRHEFRTAKTLLEQNDRLYLDRADRNTETLISQFRDEIELGSLLLTGSVQQALERHRSAVAKKQTVVVASFIDDEEIIPSFSRGVAKLWSARERLGEYQQTREFSLGDKVAEDVMRSLATMSTTNLLGAFLFERIIPGLSSPRPAVGEEVDTLLAEMESGIARAHESQKRMRPTQYIYYWCVRSLRTKDLEEKRRALADLDSHINVFLNGEGHAAGGDVSEFEWIRTWVARERQALPTE